MSEEYRFFELSLPWRQFKCEAIEGCKKSGVGIVKLTKAEWDLLPEKTGPVAERFISENRLGIVVCEGHAKP